MCQVLGVSRSGYYAWKRCPESSRAREDRRLTELIERAHQRSRAIYGAPRIHLDLREQGERCGKNRVARLMRQAGIRSKVARKFRRTTDSSHSLPVAGNLLNQNFHVTAPNAVWVADITAIHTREGWLYLASILDLYARTVVGWAMDGSMTRQLTLDALEMAVKRRRPAAGLIHHSDQGVQYAAHDFQRRLKEHGILCSMSRRGDCYDNAVVESFFHTLKTELVHHHQYRSRNEARASIFDYIETFYNRQRRHSSIGYRTPMEFERQLHVA